MPRKASTSATPVPVIEEEKTINNDQVVNDTSSINEDIIEPFYTEVEELQTHGITIVDINKLKTAGICTISGIQMSTKRNLAKIKGLSEAKVDKIKEAASKIQASINNNSK
ncbi:hypothetical protein BJ944DRAFT_253890 [Cunninghamella echinulata]|nr:hypothetical protein BJ944DRAFT_253890 [Cunninghamella echinulata]